VDYIFGREQILLGLVPTSLRIAHIHCADCRCHCRMAEECTPLRVLSSYCFLARADLLLTKKCREVRCGMRTVCPIIMFSSAAAML